MMVLNFAVAYGFSEKNSRSFENLVFTHISISRLLIFCAELSDMPVPSMWAALSSKRMF
jgi:hypothetical protein